MKGERPNLHLQIPPPSGSTSLSSQPSSAESPFPFPPDSGSSSVFFSDGPSKTPGSAEIRTDPLTRLPSQSPTSHSHPTTPLSHAGPSSLHAFSSGYSASGPQGLPQGRPASLGPFDMQPGTPGTPRRAQQVDPYFRSQLLQHQQGHLPQPHHGSQESLGPLESPHSRGAGLGESPMFSPPHNPHHGDPFRIQQGMGRLEYGASPSHSAMASSSSSTGQYRADMRAPSPRSTAAGRPDLPTGSPAGMVEPGDGLFKAPLTPRMHQAEGGTFHTGASPNHHSESHKKSPSHALSDPHAQPLTPRPQSGDGCLLGLQRQPVMQQDPCARVPSSPQSQCGSLSPHTPGGPSSDAYSVQSPATPRFQSPDPCSQPPSRPQSRDHFAPTHKPPRPPSVAQEASTSYKTSPHANQVPPTHPNNSSIGTEPLDISHNTGALQINQQHSQVAQGQLQQPQNQQNIGTESYNTRVPPLSGSQEQLTLRPPDTTHPPSLQSTQEMPDMPAVQDATLVGLSPSELEKHKQVS